MSNTAILSRVATSTSEAGQPVMTYRASLRLSATLLSAGVLLSLLASMFHVNSQQANDHVAAFTAYAHSGTWTAAHLGQFIGMAVLIAGMLVIFVALNVHTGMLGWAGRFSAVSAVSLAYDPGCHEPDAPPLRASDGASSVIAEKHQNPRPSPC